MNHLVTYLIVSYAVAYCEAILFPWSGFQTKESKPTGYLPMLKIHKYQGIQIDPIQGPSVYYPIEPNDSKNFNGPKMQLSPEQNQQLELISRFATLLSSDDNSQKIDFSSVLPYADLVSEDSLEKFKSKIEESKHKKKSKILKIIDFLKQIKKKKHDEFNNLVNEIFHKKKNLSFDTNSIKKTESFNTDIYIPYAPYHPNYNSQSFPYITNLNSYTTQSPEPSSPSSTPLYYLQYPSYSINAAQPLPSADQFPYSYPLNKPQKQPVETPAEPSTVYKLSLNDLVTPAPAQFQRVPANFQPPLNLYQLNPASFQNSIPQIQYQYLPLSIPSSEPNQAQYPASSTPSPQLAQNKISYEYKQTPSSSFAAQDNSAIRQFASINQSKLPSTSLIEPQYSYQSNANPSAARPYPSSQNSNPAPNKFYTSNNDLASAGSENDEKTAEQAQPSNAMKTDTEPLKVEDTVTSTNISIPNSQQQTSPKTTILQNVAVSNHSIVVYPTSPKDENVKDDGSKSSSAIGSTTN